MMLLTALKDQQAGDKIIEPKGSAFLKQEVSLI